MPEAAILKVEKCEDGKKKMFEADVLGERLGFETDAALFSPQGVDAGTLAMLKVVEDWRPGKLLDLGCGYGVVGLAFAKKIGESRVVMSDVNPEAVALAGRNAAHNGLAGVRVLQSDGFAQIPDRDFELILSNPPYHTDFSVAKGFIEGAFSHLALGGRLVMVTKRELWYKNKLSAVFGGVRLDTIDGYCVFTAEKRSEARPPKAKKGPGGLSKKLERKLGKRT